MNKEIAEKAVDIALQSPAQGLNFEFQGGEPLLNFEVIKHIVAYAEENKGSHEISYNVVTNLTILTDEILDFLVEHKFGISTSIDGSRFVHDLNRPFKDGSGTYAKAVAAIKKIQNRGIRVGAIQTTTRVSLKYPREIVRAYKDLGFESIFVRPLTPLGKATLNWNVIGYTPDEFLSFYREVVGEIIRINRNERFMKEEHSSILLSRIEGKFVNYMELRSPCGASVGQMAYFYDGNVFTCDEGRMLYEMGMDEYLGGDGIAAVEWPEQCSEAVPDNCLEAVLEPEGDEERRITLRSLGAFREINADWLTADEQEDKGDQKA
jgi:sulfatase maturation enzyme AslB (radical SAM superfamily)